MMSTPSASTSASAKWEATRDAPHRPPAQYPIQWMARTFTSPARTAELLRPDFEEGTITSADYRLSQAFLPGTFPIMKLTFGVIGSTIVAAVGWTRQPRWPQLKMAAGTSFGMMTGYMYGTYKQATAHFKFQNALENPTGLEQAMENVNRRMGAQQPLNISLHFARRDNLKRPDQETPSAEPTDEWDQPSAEPSPSQPAPRKPGPATRAVDEAGGRWAEIRKANSGSATDSSWDRLRQTHERARILKGPKPDKLDTSGRTTQDTTYSPTDDGERARQQAEFDAMLEAERRLGRQNEGRFGEVSSS